MLSYFQEDLLVVSVDLDKHNYKHLPCRLSTICPSACQNEHVERDTKISVRVQPYGSAVEILIYCVLVTRFTFAELPLQTTGHNSK
jgi:hypothetical protein